jgi:hypothetical protein
VRVLPRGHAEDPHPNPLPVYREREALTVYSPARPEDPRC